MIVYSYHLVTDAERLADLHAALAALSAYLALRPGLRGTTVLRRGNDALTLRFEECWESAAAHDGAMDPALKVLLKQVTASVAEPVVSTRFESVEPA